MRTQSFVITGMTCANCVNTVSKALNSNSEISEAVVNLATEKAKITANDDLTDQKIIEIVEAVGYGAIVNDKVHQEKIRQQQEKYVRNLKFSFWASLILTLPLLIAMIGNFVHFHGLESFHNPILQLILATPVQFVFGARFYKGAYHALRNKSANMDVLVALGTSVAYISSLILGIFMNQMNAVNFESSMAIITLILMGKLLEYNAKSRTSHAITALMDHREKFVRTADGNLPIEHVKIGQEIQIFAGEKVPLDSQISAGTASFDESHLTGESLPVIKSDSDMIYEGSVNLDGQITAKVVHELENSTISKMVELMSEAQGSKPNIQKLADKISGIFVPIVLGIALLTFILTFAMTGIFLTAIMHAVAVLVIACPCALGLATPTAIISGTGLAAKFGILVKNADSLELGNRIKTVFFDKTGTITTGDFELVKFDGSDENYQILASLEANSNHPLAKAVKFDGELLPVSNLTELAGQGLTGEINGKSYFAGNHKLMERFEIELPKSDDTVIYLSDGKNLLGTANFTSQIKPEAAEIIKNLKNRNIKTVMLTGDNQISAEKIQHLVKLDEVHANLSPEEKAQIVQNTENAMMIGDGINDVIALTASDIGAAMATGADLAMEVGDITIIGGKLDKISEFLDISKKTLRKIKQNYFWAFIYNLIGIPLAAFGLLNPMIAALAMSLSSVSVILNSLLLTRKNL